MLLNEVMVRFDFEKMCFVEVDVSVGRVLLVLVYFMILFEFWVEKL